MRVRCDGGTPGPESTTSTETAPLADASRSSILPPSGVQRNAFERRFVITWSTRSPSETITGAVLGPRDGVVDLAPARLLRERPVRLVEHALQVDLLLTHREPVCLELREVEHVPDESLESVGLGSDDVERRADTVRIAHDALADRLDVPPDRGQWRPQLVRDGHEERALQLLRLRELLDHPAEPLAQKRDLVATPCLRDLDVVAACRDVLGGARQHADGLGQPA